jgi:hypothetical protein
MKYSLVYVHIGNDIPQYLYDNLYQTLLINNYATTIYVCINDNVIDVFNQEIDKFNLNVYTKEELFHFQNLIQVIPLSLLEDKLKDNLYFTTYKNTIVNKYPDTGQFRNEFWISTTSRFFYIYALMEIFKLTNVFHIENDVMLYEDIYTIYEFFKFFFQVDKIDKICMVQDAPDRVIPSILYFENADLLNDLVIFISNVITNSTVFINDMNILGIYVNKYNLPLEPNDHFIIFDGASIGQYLGGIDPKNFSESQDLIIKYKNPTRGFINETSALKPNQLSLKKTNVYVDHLDIPITMYLASSESKKKYNTIANLHIHSKQLYQFSSVLNISFDDIISGDRVLSLCDFVIATREICEFHKNIEKYAKDVILINDFRNINVELLNKFFIEHCEKTNTNTIRIFVYTHILIYITQILAEKINKNIKIILYTHNSDHHFDGMFKPLVDSESIIKIYAQNVDYTIYNAKLNLLPIGIANSMWQHGDIVSLYTVISDTYKNKKNKDIYVNINPGTYSYRKEILDAITQTNCYNLSSGKPYIEYLKELAEHRFCLCIRGNGIDTHRFWESLYLGTIPVILNNNITKCNNFIMYLKDLNVPFIEIKNDNLDVLGLKYDKNYFSEKLYKNIVKKTGGIYNLKSLQISNYI